MLADASKFTVTVETTTNSRDKWKKTTTNAEETTTTSHWSGGKKVLVIGAGSSTKLESTSQIIKGIFAECFDICSELCLFAAGGECTVLCEDTEKADYNALGDKITIEIVDQKDRSAVDKLFSRVCKGPYDHVVCSTVSGENDMPHQGQVMKRPNGAGQDMSISLVKNGLPVDLQDLHTIVNAFNQNIHSRKLTLNELITALSDNSEETIKMLTDVLEELKETTKDADETQQKAENFVSHLLQHA